MLTNVYALNGIRTPSLAVSAGHFSRLSSSASALICQKVGVMTNETGMWRGVSKTVYVTDKISDYETVSN
jgi:hypothetical protein